MWLPSTKAYLSTCLFSLPAAVVQCSLEPLLNISNGYPVALTGEGEGERIEYGAERNFGYRDKVTFGCNESYRLVAESIRVCTLDGTWTGTQPHCESELTSHLATFWCYYLMVRVLSGCLCKEKIARDVW